MKHMRIVDLLGPVALLAPFLLPLQVTMAQTPTPPPGAAQVKSTPPASSAAPVATSGANSGPQVEVRDLSVSTNEVIVPVTVTDPNGKFVTNLSQADFKIFDEGQEQKISYFSAERNQPVVIGLLLDLSNSSRLHWKNYQESAIELALALLPDDDPKQRKYSGYLIAYGNEAELAVNTTYDSSKLTDRIRTLKPGGGAALYDAIYTACTSRALVKGEPLEPRRVIVIVGDGHDSASKKTLEEVIEIAQRNLVSIYGVSTKAFGFTAAGEANLTRLAEETGGRVVYPLNGLYKDVSGYLSTPSDEGNYALKVGTGGYASEIARGMFRAVSDTVGEITTQYILRYTPSSTDAAKTFRNIRVEVNLPSVKVRARKGYFPYSPNATPQK